MEKQKSIIIFIIAIAITGALILNCDKDDSPTEPSEQTIVGTWKLTKISIFTVNDTTVITETLMTQMGSYWILQLKKDNTFESDYNLEVNNENETGTWNTAGNKLNVNFDSGGTQEFEYTLSGNDLTLKWNDIEDGVEELIIGEFKRQ